MKQRLTQRQFQSFSDLDRFLYVTPGMRLGTRAGAAVLVSTGSDIHAAKNVLDPAGGKNPAGFIRTPQSCSNITTITDPFPLGKLADRPTARWVAFISIDRYFPHTQCATWHFLASMNKFHKEERPQCVCLECVGCLSTLRLHTCTIQDILVSLDLYCFRHQ
jgi:hypothetical protein